MGRKVRTQSLFYIKLTLVWIALFGLLGERAHANAHLTLVYNVQQAEEPLTSESALWFDSQLRNSHRARYALRRSVDLVQLKSFKLKTGGYGIAVQRIEAQTTYALRQAGGQWYRPWNEFPCQENSLNERDIHSFRNLIDPRFSTAESSQSAAIYAAEMWHFLLKAQLPTLEAAFLKVTAPREDQALELARQVFDRWKIGIEAVYRNKLNFEIPKYESDLLKKEAETRGLCKKGSSKSKTLPPWRELIDAPRDVTQSVEKLYPTLLARAPARKWDGMFTVRLTITAGGKSALGHFLIDSQAPVSLVSPYWLERQGNPRAAVTDQRYPPRQVKWAGGQALAKKAQFDDVKLSGYRIEGVDFYLQETNLLFPPAHVTHCCDGVLGQDFLKNYVVFWRNTVPTEIHILPKAQFSLPASQYVWTEIALDSDDRLVSHCEVKDLDADFGVSWVGWATGLSDLWKIQFPKEISKEGRDRQKVSGVQSRDTHRFQLQCDGTAFAHFNSDQTFKSEAYLPAIFGMPVLNRGNFVIDLPHGRLWVDRKGLEKEIAVNRTGVKFTFRQDTHGNRILVLTDLGGEPFRSRLLEGDLEKGTVVNRINGIEVDQLDEVEVDQVFSGKDGPLVLLEWKKNEANKALTLSLTEGLETEKKQSKARGR